MVSIGIYVHDVTAIIRILVDDKIFVACRLLLLFVIGFEGFISCGIDRIWHLFLNKGHAWIKRAATSRSSAWKLRDKPPGNPSLPLC